MNRPFSQEGAWKNHGCSFSSSLLLFNRCWKISKPVSGGTSSKAYGMWCKIVHTLLLGGWEAKRSLQVASRGNWTSHLLETHCKANCQHVGTVGITSSSTSGSHTAPRPPRRTEPTTLHLAHESDHRLRPGQRNKQIDSTRHFQSPDTLQEARDLVGYSHQSQHEGLVFPLAKPAKDQTTPSIISITPSEDHRSQPMRFTPRQALVSEWLKSEE